VTLDLPGDTGGEGEPPLTGDVAPPWWEDDPGWGDEDEWGEFPRRRRSRVLQVTGVVVAAALVLGSVGGVVGVLLDGHSVVLPTHDVAVLPADSGSHVVKITFQIENPTGATVNPVCLVTVAYQGRDLVGPGQVQLTSLAAHTRETLGFKIRTASTLPPGSQARVACQT
jgi:hypothetical protein